MRNWKTTVVNVVVLVALSFVGRAVSQEAAQRRNTGENRGDLIAGEGQPDMAEMMKKWMATTKSGPRHKWLDRFAGKWNTTTKIWMGGPGAPPMETKGSAEFRWVLDGRFMLQETKGEMLMPDATGQMKKIPHSGMGM